MVDLTNRDGAINALLRYLPLNHADVGFVRDADSRITERDRWCIDQFLKSDKSYHSIRDHYWHRSKLMAGTFGWKKPMTIMFPSCPVEYGFDEKFLAEYVYDSIKADLLVHTRCRALKGEYVEWIDCPMKDQFDFVGNVIWDGKPRFPDIRDHRELILCLRDQDHFALMRRYIQDMDLLEIHPQERTEIYLALVQAACCLSDVEMVQRVFRDCEFSDIYTPTLEQANTIIQQKVFGRIVASFDPAREPGPDEIVVVYGNYPDSHRALPSSRKIYRHASWFTQLTHDVVESHPCWNSIDIIYILNLEDRSDRYMETMVSLAQVAAPLQKVYHYKGKKNLPPYVGATKNHVDCIQHFQNSEHSNCLILEDDIVFTSDTARVQDSVEKFFQRDYNYSICFLSLSRVGDRIPCDDLLSETLQSCTTSAAYFLTKRTSHGVLAVVDEGLRKITAGEGYPNEGCIDTYWCGRLPRMYFFKDKLAFQRPSYSNLKKCVVAYLD